MTGGGNLDAAGPSARAGPEVTAGAIGPPREKALTPKGVLFILTIIELPSLDVIIMTQPGFSLSQDAYNAYMLRSVMDATAVSGETAEGTMLRSAAIVEMFRSFEPANAIESMVACHCICLRFMLDSAMRDAGNQELNPALLTRMRGMANSISKNLHLWMAKFDSLHTRNETRAEEARQGAARDGAARDGAVRGAAPRAEATAKPPQGHPPAPPLQREQPRPMTPVPPQGPSLAPRAVPQASAVLPPESATLASLTLSEARDDKTRGMKEALFASAVAVLGAPPNGRPGVAPG